MSQSYRSSRLVEHRCRCALSGRAMKHIAAALLDSILAEKRMSAGSGMFQWDWRWWWKDQSWKGAGLVSRTIQVDVPLPGRDFQKLKFLCRMQQIPCHHCYIVAQKFTWLSFLLYANNVLHAVLQMPSGWPALFVLCSEKSY